MALDLVVRDVDHGEPEALLQTANLDAHGGAELGVEVGKRLVHEAQRRLAADAAGERDALALAAGERARLAVEVVGEAQELSGLGETALLLVLGDLLDVEAEEDVVADRQVRIERVALEHHGEVAVLGKHLVGELAVMMSSPALTPSRPAMMRRSVDLPQPEGPTRMKNSPS